MGFCGEGASPSPQRSLTTKPCHHRFIASETTQNFILRLNSGLYFKEFI
jgi:hypothetical protein